MSSAQRIARTLARARTAWGLTQERISVARWRELLRLEPLSDWRLLLAERHVEPDTEHYLHASA
jgi:hypothetical protein